MIQTEVKLKNILSDYKKRKEWRRTGIHKEVAAADCFSPSKRWRHSCTGGGSTQRNYNHAYFMNLFSRSSKVERIQIL